MSSDMAVFNFLQLTNIYVSLFSLFLFYWDFTANPSNINFTSTDIRSTFIIYFKQVLLQFTE